MDAKLEEHIYISIAIPITHTLNAYFPIKKGTRVDPKLEPYVHTILYIFSHIKESSVISNLSN